MKFLKRLYRVLDHEIVPVSTRPLRCARCKYEITGIKSGPCPECGHDVCAPVFTNRKGLSVLIGVGCAIPLLAWMASFAAPPSITDVLPANTTRTLLLTAPLNFGPILWAIAAIVGGIRLMKTDKSRRRTIPWHDRVEHVLWWILLYVSLFGLANLAANAWINVLVSE